jgi:hypothetical protein
VITDSRLNKIIFTRFESSFLYDALGCLGNQKLLIWLTFGYMELHSIGIIGASFATMPAHRGTIFVTNISLEDLVLRSRVKICFLTHIGKF